MTFEMALRVAFHRASYYKIKCYVWGFQSRGGKWVYTFSDTNPGFMGLDHTT